MNLTSEKWIVGVDYSAAPTCATCHMSATREQALTHDVGQRISWTLRPIISVKKEDWEKPIWRSSKLKKELSKKHRILQILRILSQIVFFVLFFYLLLGTRFPGQDYIGRVEIFFHFDPLLALATLIASRTLFPLSLIKT